MGHVKMALSKPGASGSEKLSPSSDRAQLFSTQHCTITSTINSFALFPDVLPNANVAQA